MTSHSALCRALLLTGVAGVGKSTVADAIGGVRAAAGWIGSATGS